MNAGMNAPGPMSDEYETPPWLFKTLNAEFGFDVDAAAQETNALCPIFCNDIQKQGVRLVEKRVWCNPPYSMIPMFTKILLEPPYGYSQLVVMLLPVRSSTTWFRRLWELQKRADRPVIIRPFRQRLDFLLGGLPVMSVKHPGKVSSPRFSSMLAICG